jgi:molecular chaperone GrpE
MRLETGADDPKSNAMPEPTPQPQAPEAPQGEAAAEKSLEELLADAQARIEQQREQMMRALAEADNARKRAQAEAAALQKYAVERLAESLLPVADSLEAALGASDASPEALRSGVELTLRQLRGALEKASVREIAPLPGERFDPHRHQAVAVLEAGAEPNTVVSVMQKGYALHDRVIRPALVTVAKALESGAGNPISESDLNPNSGT